MNPIYRKKTKQIRTLELSCLGLAGVSVVVLVALLAISLKV